MKAKKGDRVLLDTSRWSESTVQRFRVTRVGSETVGGTWETGELADKEANLPRYLFDQITVEVLA